MKSVAVLLLAACGLIYVVGCSAKPVTSIPAKTDSTQKEQRVEQVSAPPAPTPAPARQHERFDTRLSQLYEEDIVNLSQGEGGTNLEVCFLSGYQGIEQPDNSQIINNVGAFSNRLRAECDAILKRQERIDAAQKAREKKLDKQYDRKRGISPAGKSGE